MAEEFHHIICYCNCRFWTFHMVVGVLQIGLYVIRSLSDMLCLKFLMNECRSRFMKTRIMPERMKLLLLEVRVLGRTSSLLSTSDSKKYVYFRFRVNFGSIYLNFAEFLAGGSLITRLKVTCMLKKCICTLDCVWYEFLLDM
jgi:hypothetical protein